jgi:hypothetical protein
MVALVVVIEYDSRKILYGGILIDSIDEYMYFSQPWLMYFHKSPQHLNVLSTSFFAHSSIIVCGVRKLLDNVGGSVSETSNILSRSWLRLMCASRTLTALFLIYREVIQTERMVSFHGDIVRHG